MSVLCLWRPWADLNWVAIPEHISKARGGGGGGGGKLEMGRITQVEKLKLDTRTADHLVEMSLVLHF